MNNQKINVKKLALAAIFMALITVTTMAISIPIPGGHGYINAGDAMIYVCAWAVGGPLGGLAAGIGAALADLLLGWAQYAPATLVIKFLMGFVCFLIMKAFKYKTLLNVFAMAAASIIMVAGYFAFDYILSGIGGAAAAVPSNLIQAAGGVVIGMILVTILDSIKALNPLIAWKADKKDEQN